MPLATTRVASGLSLPLYVTAPPGDTSRVFILEQTTGKIRILDLATNTLKPSPFMTQTDLAITGEEGLLGLAFHPQYATNGYFYVDYTRTPDGAVVVERYTVSANPDSADTTTGTVIIAVPKPTAGTNHNAGWIGFGPDGYLYVTQGDGGNNPGYYAQDDTTRYGKILRLDVDGAFPYAIPPDNPFAGGPSPKNEFWVKGLRNPWRCSIDRGTGDLYIGDVGAALWEEVDYQPASSAGGDNFGWNKFEGYAKYICPDPCDSSGLTRPIHVYDHGAGVRAAVTGGYVYRGGAIPDLQGAYFFADFRSAQIWTMRVVGGIATDLVERTAELDPPGNHDIVFPSSFGEDARGEIYVCDWAHGEVFKIIPHPTGVGGTDGEGPLALGAPTPNPSARGFTIRARIAEEGPARLRVFDASGRLVRTLFDGALPAGSRDFAWDARDERGQAVAPGIYILRMDALHAADDEKLSVVR
jgi:glucose/arabinose dehydrogenase